MWGVLWPGAHHAGPLTLLLQEIAIHPEVQEKLKQEIQATQNITKMTYLSQVVKEGLRLFTLYPILARRPAENLQVNGITLPKGVSNQNKDVSKFLLVRMLCVSILDTQK